jgi:hypothetical protein
MRILDIRPMPSGGGNGLARFDAELPNGVRLYNLKLADTPRGLRVHSPSAFGCNTATFSHEVAAQLAAAASASLGDIAPHAHVQR